MASLLKRNERTCNSDEIGLDRKGEKRSEDHCRRRFAELLTDLLHVGMNESSLNLRT